MTHVAVVGLGYGDESKGSTVDWLVRNRGAHTVVKFNGGAQSAHNVVSPIGLHHTFSQFGSGTLAGARTFVSRFTLVDPLRLTAEADHLRQLGVRGPYDRITFDAEALLTTPYHRAVNRARERSREVRHGSCGVGIGETMAYALDHVNEAPRTYDCRIPARLRTRLGLLVDWALDQFPDLDLPPVAEVVEAYRAFGETVRIVDRAVLGRVLREGPCIFEGAQGVLLDEWYGFHPHTTWSTTTFANADELLTEAGQSAEHLGVVRTFTTRHGPGPLVTEDLALHREEPHNREGVWQGAWRVGHFDGPAHRYAVDVAGRVDGLVVTHLDRVDADLRFCGAYEGVTLLHDPAHDLDRQERLGASLAHARPVYRDAVPGARPYVVGDRADEIGDYLGVPVVLTSSGPTAADKKPR